MIAVACVVCSREASRPNALSPIASFRCVSLLVISRQATDQSTVSHQSRRPSGRCRAVQVMVAARQALGCIWTTDGGMACGLRSEPRDRFASAFHAQRPPCAIASRTVLVDDISSGLDNSWWKSSVRRCPLSSRASHDEEYSRSGVAQCEVLVRGVTQTSEIVWHGPLLHDSSSS